MFFSQLGVEGRAFGGVENRECLCAGEGGGLPCGLSELKGRSGARDLALRLRNVSVIVKPLLYSLWASQRVPK